MAKNHNAKKGNDSSYYGISPDTDLDQEVDGVLSGNDWWTGDIDLAAGLPFVTYGFPVDYNVKGYKEAQGNVALSTEATDNFDTIFELIRGYTLFDNTTLKSSVNARDADIRVGAADLNGAEGWTYYPGGNDRKGTSGDVWLDTNSDNMTWGTGIGGLGSEAGTAPGTYVYTVALHEIRHAMGLKHSFEPGAFGLVPKDSLEYTVMSYTSSSPDDPDAPWPADGEGPQTFMQYDIAAMQYMYGADYGTNAGHNVYTIEDGDLYIDGNRYFSQSGSEKLSLTLWDGVGNDTYDFSNAAQGVTIDLRPGGWVTFDDN